MKTYTYYIEEVHQTFLFTVPGLFKTVDIGIVEEAARIYYFAKQGWEQAWPLTFHLFDEKQLMGKYHVFILASTPLFDVIQIE
jgi:hypothetical protein